MQLPFVTNLVVTLGLAGSLFAADPLVGTWKLKVAKSKFDGPIKPSKQMILEYHEQEGQLVGTGADVSEDGSFVLEKYTVPNTGGTVQYLQGSLPGASLTLAPRKKDSHIAGWRLAIDGKLIGTAQDVVSSDGKTLTATMRGNDAEGKPFAAVRVWERQLAGGILRFELPAAAR